MSILARLDPELAPVVEALPTEGLFDLRDILGSSSAGTTLTCIGVCHILPSGRMRVQTLARGRVPEFEVGGRGPGGGKTRQA